MNPNEFFSINSNFELLLKRIIQKETKTADLIIISEIKIYIKNDFK